MTVINLIVHLQSRASSALVVITSFIDAQLMFWWFANLIRTLSIEYIIPRAKTGSMGKTNMLNQYAQSWVFDSDTVGSSQSETPHNKMHSQLNGSKTVVLKRKSVCEQLIVIVEDTVSFSRTPLPVPHSLPLPLHYFAYYNNN